MRKRRLIWVGGTVVIAVVVTAVTVLRSDRGQTRPPEERSYEEHVRRSLFDLLQPVRLSNCTLERFGEPHDGGYLVCANLLDAVQSGYSYGISGYDQWGCDVSRRRKVQVHEYDCFDLREPACDGGDLHFHAECVGPGTTRDEDGRLFDTMSNHIRRNGDLGKQLIVKIDVEGAEWDSFLLASDELFERIDQLSVEFHGVHEDRFVAAVGRLTRFFHVVNLHFNNYSCDPSLAPFPAGAYEVLFVSKRLGVVDESGTVTRPHPLDAPNKPDGPDCQHAGG